MDPVKRIAAFLDGMLDYAFASFFFVLAAFVMLPAWRKQPHLAVAALCVGPVLGYAGALAWGPAAGVVVTFLCTIGAPALVIWASGPKMLPKLAESVLKKFGDKEGD